MSIPLIPFHDFRIVCNRPKDEVVRILTNHIGSWGDYNFPFYGSMNSHDFKILRRTHFWRNSKKGIVYEGTVDSEDNATVVDIRARFNFLSLTLPILFFGFMIAEFISLWFAEDPANIRWPFGLTILGFYTIQTALFAFDVRRAKEELANILRGYIE